MNLENMNRMEMVEKFLSLLESAIHRKAKPKKEYYHRSRLHKSKLHKTRIHKTSMHKTSMHRDKLYRFRKLDPEKKRVVSKRNNKKQWNQYAKIVEALYEYVYECANEGQRHENRIKEKPEIVKTKNDRAKNDRTKNEKIKNYDQTKSKDHSMDLLKHMNERIDALPVMHQLLSFVLVVALIMGFLLNMIEKTLLSVVCVCYSALCLHDLFRFTSHRRKLIMNVERCLDDSIRVSQNEYNHIIEDTNRMTGRRVAFGRTSIDIIVLILWSINIGWYKIL